MNHIHQYKQFSYSRVKIIGIFLFLLFSFPFISRTVNHADTLGVFHVRTARYDYLVVVCVAFCYRKKGGKREKERGGWDEKWCSCPDKRSSQKLVTTYVRVEKWVEGDE